MNTEKNAEEGFVPVADIQVDAVRPEKSGFVLQGKGVDRADYRVELRLDIPVDGQTRTVLGEILSQSDLKVLRRVQVSIRRSKARQRRKPVGS